MKGKALTFKGLPKVTHFYQLSLLPQTFYKQGHRLGSKCSHTQSFVDISHPKVKQRHCCTGISSDEGYQWFTKPGDSSCLLPQFLHHISC